MSLLQKLLNKNRSPSDQAITKEDLMAMRRQIEADRIRAEMRGTGLSSAKKLARMMGKGIGDIGKSLATPNTKKRPKISQMPIGKPPIARRINSEFLKPKGLKGKNINSKFV